MKPSCLASPFSTPSALDGVAQVNDAVRNKRNLMFTAPDVFDPLLCRQLQRIGVTPGLPFEEAAVL
jgi:hypothetical protein